MQRGFRHDAIHGEAELFDDLVDRKRRQGPVAATAIGQQTVRVVDGGFPALHGNIHELRPP